MHHVRPQSSCSFVYDGAKLSLIDVTARDVRHSLIVALLSHAANSDSKCMLEACVDLDGPSSGQNSQPLLPGPTGTEECRAGTPVLISTSNLCRGIGAREKVIPTRNVQLRLTESGPPIS